MQKLVNVVLNLDVVKGHLKWKVSEVARVSKVTRTSLYYHLGRNKLQILKSCVELAAREFYGLSPKRIQMLRDGRVQECVRMSQDLCQKYPEFMVFYFRWRMKKSPMQATLIELENVYRKKLSSVFPHLSPIELVAVHALLQGLISSPFLTREAFNEALTHIGNATKPKRKSV